MVTGILANLARQKRAMELLVELLMEEFSLLAARDTAGITSLEFSIQELLRQIAGERLSLRRRYAAMSWTSRAWPRTRCCRPSGKIPSPSSPTAPASA